MQHNRVRQRCKRGRGVLPRCHDARGASLAARRNLALCGGGGRARGAARRHGRRRLAATHCTDHGGRANAKPWRTDRARALPPARVRRQARAEQARGGPLHHGRYAALQRLMHHAFISRGDRLRRAYGDRLRLRLRLRPALARFSFFSFFSLFSFRKSFLCFLRSRSPLSRLRLRSRTPRAASAAGATPAATAAAGAAAAAVPARKT
jgi:hypothetical protein